MFFLFFLFFFLFSFLLSFLLLFFFFKDGRLGKHISTPARSQPVVPRDFNFMLQFHTLEGIFHLVAGVGRV